MIQKPSFWRVLSDTSRIISSNSLHFAALSLLFIFPISLFNILHTLLLPTSPSPSPFNSHYRHLLSTHDADKSQILYGLLLLIFNLFAVSSVTHSIVHGFHQTKPVQLAASLKSILSSFLPLLATKAAYLTIIAAILFSFGICVGFVLLSLMFLGLEIEPTSKPVMAVAFVMAILLMAMLVYLEVKWCLMDAIVVAESKYGFAPFERSSNLVKGAKLVGFLMMLLFAILHLILSGWFSALAGGARTSNGVGVVVQLVVYGGLSTVLWLFGLAAKAVLFIHCKEYNGESEFQSDEKKLGQVYVPLPRDVVDEV